MTKRSLTVTDELYRYILSVSVHESELLKRLREETSQGPNCNMQISPEQGQFMGLMVTLLQAQNIIEIGTFTGYSALCLAMSMPVDGQLVCCDIDEKWTNIAKRYWKQAGLEDKIDLKLAPAMETLTTLLDQGKSESFDIIFIDADKENYLNYYESSLQLLRQGGLIMVDNTLWGSHVIDPEDNSPDTQSIRAFNAALYQDKRVDISLLPLSDGLTLAIKK